MTVFSAKCNDTIFIYIIKVIIVMKAQFNSKISTKGFGVGEFTSEVKKELAVFNQARNWKTVEFENVFAFYQYFIENLHTFRFGMKTKSNAKKDTINEIWGLALDLDLKPDLEKGIIGCSVKRTKEFAKDFTHIFYLSPSGNNNDNSPHRLLLFFDNPQTIEIAEKYTKYLSFLLQGKSICFDITRIWFPPLEHTIHLSSCSLGHGLETLEIPQYQVTSSVPKKIYSEQPNQKVSNSNSLSTKINRLLTEKALEMGFSEFLHQINISDVQIQKSKRSPENGTIAGEATERFDVKPVDSNCKDRVTCNLIDGVLYFYDRRDGTAGYTGSFLKFLLLSTGESNVDFSNQIAYAKEIFQTLELSYPEQSKKIEASKIWYEFLLDNKDYLIYIKDSQKYAFFNGKYWELYNPEKLIDTVFINWVIANYGIIKAAVIGSIKRDISHITFDLIPSFKTQPHNRNLYGFQDGVFNIETKEFLPFNNSYHIWNISDFFFNDTDLETGKKSFDLLKELVSKIVIGDINKQTNFLDGFSLLVLDQLWKTQTMIWMYGEGGSGKSTLANWIRDMLGSASDNGRVSDLRANEIFNSPHSLQKIIQGTIINLSEFQFPSITDSAFLKDLIASGATENSTKMRGGCSIPINEKYKNPYTAFWIGSLIASSQERPSKDCLLDSGWTRRINFFSFQKAKENTDLFKLIDANLNQLFVYILHQDVEMIINRYNNHFRNPDVANEQLMEIEISPVASYLNDNCEISDKEETPIKVLYREFHHHKAEYGWPNNYSISLLNFEKYLNRYLSKFYGLSSYIDDNNVKVSKLKLKPLIAITTSNGEFGQ